MNRGLYAQVEEIFDAAVELPPGEQESFLQRACQGSDELLSQVKRLLKADGDSEFLDRPVARRPEGVLLDSPDPTPAGSGSQVFLVSTSSDLAAFRTAAREVIAELGAESVERRANDSVSEVARQVARADLVVAIIGWRPGDAPPASAGGDGVRPWAYWEVQYAFECEKPIVVLMADDSLRPEGATRDEVSESRAIMADFRGELSRLATPFGVEPQGGLTQSSVSENGSVSERSASTSTVSINTVSINTVSTFRDKLRAGLPSAEPAEPSRPSELPPATTGLATTGLATTGLATTGLATTGLATIGPVPWTDSTWPERPYPLLLPYSRPELMAGRDRDLQTLSSLLRRPIPILGLSAASGMGKSSLLMGGLVPLLRSEGYAISLERNPSEPGLASRLTADLMSGLGTLRLGPMVPERFAEQDGEGGAGVGVGEEVGLSGFIDRLTEIRLATGKPPVLVIDQLDDLFRTDPTGAVDVRTRLARASLGALLASSAQRLPGLDEPPCRWLLACRQELFGRLCQWLVDVLIDARAEDWPEVSSLPHDFSRPTRFHHLALGPLGAPDPACDDPLAAATKIFQAAIEKPLQWQSSEGVARYPWRFEGDGAFRLARAFAAARLDRPDAPLAPELQAVLSLLLDDAGEPDGRSQVIVSVPADPETLIDQALEGHLRRALSIAFPTSSEQGRISRTRALWVLRELADSKGRRRGGEAVRTLAEAMDESMHGLLAQLSTPQTRLVIQEQIEEEWVYTLSHDKLAEVVARLFDEGLFTGLGADLELLQLHRFVTLRSALFKAGDTDQATRLERSEVRRIELDQKVVIWGDESERWWAAARRRWRMERRRQWLKALAALLLITAATWGAWEWESRQNHYREQLEQIMTGSPEVAFSVLTEAIEKEEQARADLETSWRQRRRPFDVFDLGLGGIPAGADRAHAVVQVATLGQRILVEAPEDPELIAPLIWALDSFALEDPSTQSRAWQLRREILKPLRERRPPAPLPSKGDADWVMLTDSTFFMGAGPGEGREGEMMDDERPRHQVTLSGFWIQIHETTQADYQRLIPNPDPVVSVEKAQYPQTSISWYSAYTYAAWLGGRLPTEAEWEFAARAGCKHHWCRRDGSEASLDEVSWGRANSTAVSGVVLNQPVMGLEPNPFGLYDMIGNVAVWISDWFGPYEGQAQVNPKGPASSTMGGRCWRGGHVWIPEIWMMPSSRGIQVPTPGSINTGVRVVIPELFFRLASSD